MEDCALTVSELRIVILFYFLLWSEVTDERTDAVTNHVHRNSFVHELENW